MKELVDYVKKNPGLGLATSGVGSNQHVIGEWFAKEAGIKLEHVPYRGAGQAINDLIAAHVKVAFLGPTALMPHCTGRHAEAAGAVDGASARRRCRRSRRWRRAGYKGLVLEAWYAAFVPKGTPPAIVAKLNDEMNKALKDPKLLETFTKGAIEPIGGTPDEIGKLAQAEFGEVRPAGERAQHQDQLSRVCGGSVANGRRILRRAGGHARGLRVCKSRRPATI